MTKETLCDCGHIAISEGCGTGYGVNREGEKICFACCGEQDKQAMREDGKATLYLSNNEITNWPGTLRLRADYVRTGRHNIAGKRYDVWFHFENQQWHGVQYGDNTNILHCKKLKQRKVA